MKQSHLYALWGALFILCAGLGFIPNVQGGWEILLFLLSLGFFVPPALLMYQAHKIKNPFSLRLIRTLSILSLSLSLLLLVLSILTALAAGWIGSMIHVLLVILSTPMICSGYWAVSLFGWACLLLTSIHLLKQQKH